ncbi:DUF6190 family protein [Kitasatospora sp. NPDC048540]|uniref:DUF6190 family protein n=1 Tax=Kitasatospora sp. NPDC048540 TaxID=3155634 RepID=UPI00340E3A98
MSRAETFIDGTAFMAMHSSDEAVRRSFKAFFAGRLSDRVVLNLEQVGWCDNLVWQYSRQVQDAYYPFMDNLHTDMRIDRIGYSEEDLAAAAADPALTGLPLIKRLLVGQVANRGGTLVTADPELLACTGLPVTALPLPAVEPVFPGLLEPLYQDSLALRVASFGPQETS